MWEKIESGFNLKM